ncbi:MAG: (2Fe-2S)-binding protein [Candidatus Neomarinimicrobiota bacterium]
MAKKIPGLKYSLSLTVNGKKIRQEVASDLRLLDFLREELKLTGAKDVCSEGECGACTIIWDGKIVNSCLILAVEAEGAQILTVEGLGGTDSLNKLQQAFIDKHGVQCGYCIPGFVIAGYQLLKDEALPSTETIRERLAGNICRCTGYEKIIKAVESARQD